MKNIYNGTFTGDFFFGDGEKNSVKRTIKVLCVIGKKFIVYDINTGETAVFSYEVFHNISFIPDPTHVVE